MDLSIELRNLMLLMAWAGSARGIISATETDPAMDLATFMADRIADADASRSIRSWGAAASLPPQTMITESNFEPSCLNSFNLLCTSWACAPGMQHTIWLGNFDSSKFLMMLLPMISDFIASTDSDVCDVLAFGDFTNSKSFVFCSTKTSLCFLRCEISDCKHCSWISERLTNCVRSDTSVVNSTMFASTRLISPAMLRQFGHDQKPIASPEFPSFQ